MAYSAWRSNGPVLHSISPLGSSCSARTSYFSATSSASTFASSRSTFLAHSSALLQRSTSLTRVSYGIHSAFSPDHSISQSGSISMSHKQANTVQKPRKISLPKKTCICLPTNHPGSFCCSLHNSFGNSHNHNQTVPYNSNRLNLRCFAMLNSLLRIGIVKGDFDKRALVTRVRTSSHQQCREEHFQPRPSRLSRVSKA